MHSNIHNGKVLDPSQPGRSIAVVNPPAEPTPLTDSMSYSTVTHDLLDALPKVWTRGLLYLLVIGTATLVPWSMLSRVEETGSARGRLEPQNKTVQLDAPVAGTVEAINVKEGESVKAGQILMELESDQLRAELNQTQAKRTGLVDRLTQLELLNHQLEMTTRTQRLQNQAQIAAQLAEIEQTQQGVEFNRSAHELTQFLLSKDQDNVQRFRTAHAEGVVSLLQVDDAERSLIESQQQLQKNQADIEQSQSELKRQRSTHESLIRQGELAVLENQQQIKELQAQITDTQTELAQTQDQIRSLELQLQQRVLKAPIDGTLFQLPIAAAGAVVEPAELVAEIAPKGTPLILKAEMPSQESGFLQVGMPAKVKFDAYPFQDYGVVAGYVNWVSPDSKLIQTDQGHLEVFEVRIALDQPYIPQSDRRITLTPGQTATAEVIIRQRRVIDFILDPFRKLRIEGLKL